ncbi:MAG: hypothetical protein AB1925_17785 [Actinomycetota bacterium]
MTAAILFVSVGLIVGALLVAAPRWLWWSTQSWRFRHPEVNTPGPRGLRAIRCGGATLLLVALLSGSTLVFLDEKKQESMQTSRKSNQPEASFVPPLLERRGLLPIVGYFAEASADGGRGVEVYYLAPDGAGLITDGSAGTEAGPCTVNSSVNAGRKGRLHVNLELLWAPRETRELGSSDRCKFRGRHTVQRLTVHDVAEVSDVTTDAAIVHVDRTQVAAQTSANAVPKLDDPIDISDIPRVSVSDRGEIPIVGYKIENGYLKLSYLVPKASGAEAGSLDGLATDGCETVPFFTGLGTATISVQLRLRWSDPDDRYGDEDDARCNVGPAWSELLTSQWGVVGEGNDVSILTDGPVCDRAGHVIEPARPGNRLRRLE